MKRHIYKYLSSVLLIVFTLVLFPHLNLANNVSNVAGFTYSIEYPETQMDKSLGYYKLKVSPNQKQVFQLSVTNPTDKALTVDVSLNGAKTNSNGVIEYEDNELKFDKSLPYNFKDIVKGPESVELGPNESKKLDFTVQIPEKHFNGIISGGITLMKRGQDNVSDSGNGSQIINQYVYIIGVVLQENEAIVKENLLLNSVKPGQSNGRNSIDINFSNVTPTYVDKMSIKVDIKKKGKSKVLFSKSQEDMRMAPNTEINYPVLLNNEAMKSGNYVADIVVKSKNGEWKWTKEFTITKEEASAYNKKDVNLIQEKPDYTKLIIMIIIVVLIGLIGYFIFRHSKKGDK